MIELQGLVRALFEGPNYAHLATLLPDGGQHPSDGGPGGQVQMFLTGPTSGKGRNLDHNTRVALSVTDLARPFTMVEGRGRVIRRVEGDQAWPIIHRISNKYTGQPYPLRTD